MDRPFELKKKILEKKILDKIENIMTNNFFFNKYNLILIDIERVISEQNGPIKKHIY